MESMWWDSGSDQQRQNNEKTRGNCAYIIFSFSGFLISDLSPQIHGGTVAGLVTLLFAPYFDFLKILRRKNVSRSRSPIY